VEGTRHWVTGADGVRIGLLTAGSGPGLLLVHGGMATIEAWHGVWEALTGQWRVTAMDRRGRGSSGDAGTYTLDSEFADVAAVAAAMAAEYGGPVDVAGHSIGATCVLGAAALGAPFRRIVLYEPAGPQSVQNNWPGRLAAMVADGQVGRAAFTFLTEIIGLTRAEVEALRDAPGGRDVLPIVAATLPREARGLAAADLPGAARKVRQPVLLLLGTASPRWAGQITAELAAALPAATVSELPGAGHEALDRTPDQITAALARFLSGQGSGSVAERGQG
jgi:pimeloyl-ACP methyl ester carboxylesterase